MRRTNMFKLVTILMMVLILAVSVIGCTQKAAPAPDPGPDAGKETEIPAVKLTYAALDTPPQTYALVDLDFIDHIKEVSNGKITFDYYPGGTLISGSEAAAEIADGVADFGWPRPGYSKNGFKLYNASMIWMYNLHPIEDVKAEIEIFKKMCEQPQVKKELAGLMPYGVNAGGTEAYLFMTKPFTKLSDIKGKTIRATGAWADVVKGLGGVPITIPMSETYLALEKGTVDGTLGLDATVLKAQNFADVMKGGMPLGINMAPYHSWAFNADKWNSLPQPIKDIFLAEEAWLEAKVIQQLQSELEPAIKHGADKGVQYVKISDEDLQTLYTVMDQVCREQTKKLDETGLEATKTFEYVQGLVKEYKSKK